MTISSTNSRMTYTGNGATSSYSFTYKIFDQGDLLVTVKDVDGFETTLAIITDYTVTMNANGTGSIQLVSSGQSWLTGGNLTTDYKLVIRRVVDVVQETDIRNQGEFFPEVHEDAFDYQTMIQQQQKDEIDRSIKLPETETGVMTIPTLEERVNTVFGFDALGKPIAATGVSSVPVTPFMATLLDDTSAAAAKATLGFSGTGGNVATANIDDNTITNAKLRDSAAASVIGRSVNSVGDPADIVASSNDNVLKREGDALVFGKVKNNDILDGTITPSKLNASSSFVDVVIEQDYDFENRGAFKAIPQYPWGSETKLSNPGTLPTGVGRTVSFSPGDEYLAIAHTITPFITIYQRSGKEFVKLSNPATLPAGQGNSCDFSPSGEFLAVAHSTTPFITVYQRSGSTFTKLTNPASLPAGQGNTCKWSPNGEILAVGNSISQFLTLYQRSGTTLTALPPVGTLPTQLVTGLAWSPNGRYLATKFSGAPYLHVYERTNGFTFTKLADPAVLPTANSGDVAWSPSGDLLLVSQNAAPRLMAYTVVGSTVTNITNPPNQIASGTIDSIAFSASGKTVAVAHNDIDLVGLYSVSGTTLTALPVLGTPPTSDANGITFSKTGEYLVVGSTLTPFIHIYQTGLDMPDSGIMVLKKIPRETF